MRHVKYPKLYIIPLYGIYRIFIGFYLRDNSKPISIVNKTVFINLFYKILTSSSATKLSGIQNESSWPVHISGKICYLMCTGPLNQYFVLFGSNKNPYQWMIEETMLIKTR